MDIGVMATDPNDPVDPADHFGYFDTRPVAQRVREEAIVRIGENERAGAEEFELGIGIVRKPCDSRFHRGRLEHGFNW